MADFIPINYRDFYDFPRIFIVVDAGVTYLFDSSFDEASDDYSAFYTVCILPPLTREELQGSWVSLSDRAVGYLGHVPVTQVRFDESKRQSIDRASLQSVLAAEPPLVEDSFTLDGTPVDPSIIKAASLSQGWIEVSEFVSLPDGSKRLIAKMEIDGEQPIVRRKFGTVRRTQPAV
jgi:hypothetical protein